MTYKISFGISSVDGYSCKHPEFHTKMVEGFKIISFKRPNIMEIQFYDQYFDITTNALAASWAGRFILFRHWYWIRLLQTVFKRNDRPFRLINAQTGYLIGGSCCGHSTPISDAELAECLEGGILLAESLGGWGRFIEHMRTYSARFMWMKFGKHFSSPTPKFSRLTTLWKEFDLPKRRGVRVTRKPRMRQREGRPGKPQTEDIDDLEFASYEEDSRT